MLKKEKLKWLYSQIPEDKHEAFTEEMKKARGHEEILAILKKYGVDLKEEDLADFKEDRELSDDEMDVAAGGCEPCSELSCVISG